MRISDWSSDVCSSDLIIETARAAMPVELMDVAAPVRDGMALPAIDDHGIRRWLYRSRQPFERAALAALLDDLPPSLLRLKGWCRIAGTAQQIGRAHV